MFLKRIKLANFKNYTQADFEFSSKINCFIGNNGAGKTNVLDAIHYLSFCKSYFNSIDSQNIRHEEAFFSIHGIYEKNGNTADDVSCILKRSQKKQFLLNDKEYERLADHIGLYPLVMISPYDRDLINEGSETRRKYIDSVISQFNKVYLNDLINYNKVLLQRNALLKRFAEKNFYDRSSLEIWDEQLTDLGEKIHQTRKEFIQQFAPLFQQYFELISGGQEKVSIEYDSQLFERSLSELLAISVDRDRILKYTSAGTHKDDLSLSINGHPVKKFGSQGQQKSYVVAIKLAQFEYTRSIKGYKPILLLDDIFDKLDGSRVKQIIELVNQNNFGQVFITDTQHQRINEIFQEVNTEHKIFQIESGTFTVIE